MTDTVSIIIPLYNGEKFIAAALDSCLEQTYPQIEVVVCDDCSTDMGVSLVEEYVKQHSFIRLLKNEENLGNIKTVNKALSFAKGEYILVFGQDDLLPPKHIEIILKYFDNNTALVFCNYTLINEKSIPINMAEIKYQHDITIFDLAKNNCLHSCGLISRKDCLEKVGSYSYNSAWKNYGEWDLWIKMTQTGILKYCPETKALYRRHEDNMTNEFKDKQKYKIHREYCICCMKLAKELAEFNICQLSIYYFNYAMYYFKSLIHYMRIKECEK